MRIVVVNLSVRTISGGYEEYLNQFFNWAEKDADVDEILFVSVATILERFKGLPKIKLLPISRFNALLGTAYGVASAIKDFRPDLLFIPMEKRFRGVYGIPVVTMLQNMEPFVPEISGNSLLWQLILITMRRRAQAAIKHADHIIALSSFVKSTLVSTLKIDPAKITRIPHGKHDFTGFVPMKPKSLQNEKDFIFTAGSLSPARGLDDLVEAFIKLKLRGKIENTSLCIAGDVHKYNRGWFKKLLASINDSGLEDEVIWLGFLSKTEMMWCFQHARLFVMTSRVESFGITAVEAMANKACVISSDSPCLPETFGQYPDYYHAEDIDDLSDKISKVLSRKERVFDLPDNQLSWQENFALTMNLFKKLVSEK